MTDFERAAARLKKNNETGKSGQALRPTAEIEETNGQQESLEKLREILHTKRSEPIDVLLSEEAATSIPAIELEVQSQDSAENSGASSLLSEASASEHLLYAPKATIGDPANVEKKHSTDARTQGGNRLDGSHKKLELSFSSLAERGFITPSTAKGRITEEYRRIKRPLLKQMNGADPASHLNVIMVTSSVQGEGKTYTAVNLAVSMAQEKNRSVLLVDADVVKGTAGRELGCDVNESGLLDLLSQSYSHASEVIMSTNIPGLSFMPAGKADDNANELLTSLRMRDTVDAIARESTERILVLDCPPILQTNEANALAEYAGQIVFVVAEQQTSQSLVQEALRHLDRDKYVGMLLNKSSSVGAGYGYGQGYY